MSGAYDEEADFDRIAESLRSLRAKDSAARSFLDIMAARERDPSSTSISRMAKIIRADRTRAVELAKALEEAGCGKYVVGRRGGISRFEWAWSASSLGQVASGVETEIAKFDPLSAEVEEEPGESEMAQPNAPLTLTIPQAKEALARALGVPVENIEIIIRG